MYNHFYHFFTFFLCFLSINIGFAEPHDFLIDDLRTAIVVNQDDQINAGAPFFITETAALIGEEACVEVLTESYNNVSGFQFTLNFDPSILSYSSIQVNSSAIDGLSLAENFNISLAANGSISVVYFEPMGEDLSLPDSTMLFEICFTAIAEGVSPISFESDPTPLVILDSLLNDIPFSGENGTIEVLLCQDTLITIDTTICVGESVIVGGTVYTTPGAYENMLTSSLGCDSTIVLNLSIEDVGLTFPDTIGVCSGEQAILQVPDTVLIGFPNGPLGQSIILGFGTFNIALQNINNGCEATQSITIVELPLPDVAIEGDTAFCLGDTLKLEATGALTYLWGSGQTTVEIEVTTPGTYTVVGTSVDGCENSADITVTELPLPDIIIDGDTSFCIGDTLLLEATGASTYLWNNGQTTAQIEVTTPGTYTVVGTSVDGCENSAGITVTELPLPDVTISGDDAFCSGDTLSLEATGASTYLWSNGQTTAQIEVTTPGTYTVVGTSVDGCENSAGITVTELPLPDVMISGDDAFCPGDTLSLEATGASTYLWSNGQTTAQIEVTTPGTYTVVGTSVDGCENSAGITVTELPLPDIIIEGDTAFCIGDTLSLEATGASTYLWSNGQTTAQIEVTTPGTYTVVGTSVDGCENSAGITVTELPLPDVMISGDDAFCSGDTLSLEATGASTYLWSNGQTTAQIEVTTPGTYTVVGMSVDGCENSAGITVTELPLPDVTISGDDAFCSGDTLLLEATGALTYLWSNGQTTAQIEVTTPGTYTVVGTSVDGCENSAGITVTELPLPDVMISGDDAFCSGDTLSLEATGASTYLWSNGQTTAQIEVTTPGTYTVVGTSVDGCENSAGITVTELPLPDVMISGDDAFCSGDTLSLEATGASTYLWSNGQTTAQIEVTTPGTYTVVGTSVDGCENSAGITVTELPLPDVMITGDLEICEGASTTLTALGAATYLWNTNETTASITVATSGVYSVTGTSAEGCESIASVTVVAFQPPVVAILGDTQVCGQDQTALTAIGGISYVWSTGATTAQITVGAGTYSVTATDTNGCVGEASITVLGDTEAPELLFCPSGANGVLNFGETEIAVNWVEPIAEDNCGDANLTVTQTHQPGDLFTLGATTVTYTFTDEAGNSTSCEFDVIIENSADLTFYVDTLDYTVSIDTFCVPIRILDFDEVAGFQYTIQAPDVLQSSIFDFEPSSVLQGGGNLNGLNTFEVAPNTYSVVWANDNGQGLTLPDSTIIFTVKMIISAPPGACVPLIFENSPVEIEAVQIASPTPVVPTVIDGEICVRNLVDVVGQIYKIDDTPIDSVIVTLNGPDVLVDVTNPAGLYSFEDQPAGEDYVLVPEKNTDHPDGISIFDLVTINRHILFIEQITNPYLLIASDVNSTQTITIADLVDIRDLILGITLEFPSSPSWRFVPVDYTFPVPLNPWFDPFPEQAELLNLNADADVDFYGIKIGDINLSATGLQGGEESFGTFMVEDQQFEAGEIVEVTLSAADARMLAGLQFELRFDPHVLAFQGIEQGSLSNFDTRRSVDYKATNEGRLPIVWFNELLSLQDRNASLMTLTFRAIRSGKLSEILAIANDQMKGIAVTSDLNHSLVKLSFVKQHSLPVEVEQSKLKQLYCAPNPFSAATEVVFQLEQKDQVVISVFDASGRLLSEEKLNLDMGTHYYQINSKLLPESGVYTCRVRSSNSVGTIRMLKQ